MVVYTGTDGPVIDAQHLDAGYIPGINILNDCSLQAYPGELIGITAGLPDQELGTNLFEVHRVP